jgi:ornithine cyclodeaminase/alanine dehydrogenase-like protein (mu-crystallin family)
MTLIMSNEDIEKVLTVQHCTEVLEAAFKDLAEGKAVNRPRSHTYTPVSNDNYYLFKSMDGSVPRYGVHALRLTSEIIRDHRVGEAMRSEKLPSLPGGKWLGLVLLFSIQDGALLAIMQDGYLQRMRVGATSGIAAKYLSRQDSQVVGLFGSGWQAGAQLIALCAVRNIKLIKVYSPNPENRKRFVSEMEKLLKVEIHALDKPKEIVEGSDIVVGATNSFDPVFDGDWLVSGMHVNSVQGGEIDARTLERADVVVIRSRERGTYWFPRDSQPRGSDREKRFQEVNLEPKIRELGEVILGKVSGRTDPRQITFFGGGGTAGSNGLGIQFAAVAAKIYELARERGLGREVPLDWFTESVHP